MIREDAYTSRTGGDSFVIPRKDPIVHPWREDRRGATSPSSEPLSLAELDAFENDGFLTFDSILSRSAIREVQSRAEQLRTRASTTSQPEVIREPESDEIRSIFALHQTDPFFARQLSSSSLVGAAEQILGSPVYIHQSRINYKPAFVGKEFYWHSDFETWHVEDGMPRMRAVSFSISLTENRLENGPLMVIPGSHRHFVSCPGETPEHHYRTSLRRQELGVPPQSVLTRLARQGGLRSPTGPPGSAILFDSNLMHGSNGNITPIPRTMLFVVFNSVENALEAPYSGQPPRPEYIGSRDPKPLG